MPPAPRIYIEQPRCRGCKDWYSCVVDGIREVLLSLRGSNMDRKMMIRQAVKLRQESALAKMRPRPSREGFWTLFHHSFPFLPTSHYSSHQSLARQTNNRNGWLKRTAILPQSRATRRIRITTNSHNNRCPRRMRPPFPMRQLH